MMTTHSQLMSGVVVLLPDGCQAVVHHAWDGEPVEVVRTGGRGGSAVYPADDLTPLTYRGDAVGVCLWCGDVWKRHGSRTSHCRGCHETFEGGEVWEAHRVQSAGGKFVCQRAAAMIFRGRRLRKEADPVKGLVTVGTWRGPTFDGSVFGDDAA